MDSIKELEQIFSSKNNYQQYILEQSLIIYDDHNDRLNRTLENIDDNSITNDQVKKIKTIYSIRLLTLRIQKLTENIRQNISYKMDELVENHLKINYLEIKLQKISAIISNADSIFNDFSIKINIKEEDEFSENSLQCYETFVPCIKSNTYLAEDCIEDVFKYTNSLIDFLNFDKLNETKKHLENICIEKVLVFHICLSTEHLRSLLSNIIMDNQLLLGNEYLIIKNDGNYNLLKKGIQTKKIPLFTTTFKKEQLELLFSKLKNDKFIDSDFDNFFSIFNNETLPKNFKPIKWIYLTTQKKPHKTSLKFLLIFITGKAPYQKTVDLCFTDIDDNKIKLPKTKKEAFSNHWVTKFKCMLQQ